MIEPVTYSNPVQPWETRSAMRSGWNEQAMLMKGKLSDRQIDRYERAGYYSAAAIASRKEQRAILAAKRQNKRRNDDTPANFRRAEDGRLIYCPA